MLLEHGSRLTGEDIRLSDCGSIIGAACNQIERDDLTARAAKNTRLTFSRLQESC